jgi:hypothetical protein
MQATTGATTAPATGVESKKGILKLGGARWEDANVGAVWTTLITNTAYLTGLLTLDYSLKKHGTKYPLIALYTDTFPEEGHKALDERGIPKQHVKYLLPIKSKDFAQDPRFYDCWSKLTPFSLEEYDRVVQLDSDMLVLQNMDELMDLELDAPSTGGKGDRVFAASHACVCNPLKKPHYPKDWYVSKLDYMQRDVRLTHILGYQRTAPSRPSTRIPPKHKTQARPQQPVCACPTAACKS